MTKSFFLIILLAISAVNASEEDRVGKLPPDPFAESRSISVRNSGTHIGEIFKTSETPEDITVRIGLSARSTAFSTDEQFVWEENIRSVFQWLRSQRLPNIFVQLNDDRYHITEEVLKKLGFQNEGRFWTSCCHTVVPIGGELLERARSDGGAPGSGKLLDLAVAVAAE